VRRETNGRLDARIAPFARRRRSRIDAACPNCRHARDCMTRSFAGTACGASPVSVVIRARRRTKASASLTCKLGSMFTLGGMNGLRVAELAARAGVAASTVRFYERAGLLSPARRAVNGYRIFDETALEELAFIQRAKAIRMSHPPAATSARTAPSCSPILCWAATPPANQPPPSPGSAASGQSPRISRHRMTANRPSSAVAAQRRGR
jgi:hypothetical protein